MKTMKKKYQYKVIVINQDGDIVGVLTKSDVLKRILGEK